MPKKVSLSIVIVSIISLLLACKKPESDYKFQLLDAEKTGINFSNDLLPNKDQNIFAYMYFYNGSGVGAGDFNNDGKVDLFFAANMKDNKLYLNKSKMQFEDITQKAFKNINKNTKGWSNGVSVVDINQDGKLDIYVSQVGGFDTFKAHNLLFVCKEIDKDGIPIYEEKSKDYGLDLVGLGTQAAFFDYDLDGDLDMFQLNHSVHQNGTFGMRSAFQVKMHQTAGDKFFRNDNGKFIEITQKTGILSDVLGYGLGIGLGDVNFDGYTDMYIGNDFHENDYLYINQKNGSFKEDLTNEIMHTSQFSMGIDIGDINNDIFPEIISLDMLPYDREILKRSEGEDSYNIYKYKLSWGYNNQFSRNNLQLNNRNNTFSEIGAYSKIYATDWSWSPLWMDFDNDGNKDLFISNGIPKRMNDMDYLLFISDSNIQRKIDNKEFDENDQLLIDKLPEIKIPNKFFHNSTNLQFADLENQIKNNKNSYSNGAVYADLDNDGDLDIVTNNINDKAFVYENLANNNNSLTINLKGSAQNKNAIGAKCLVFKKGEVLSFEKYPVRGFQSSMEVPLTIGLGNKATIDSILLIWPDSRYQKLKYDTSKNNIQHNYNTQLPFFDYDACKQKMVKGYTFEDITKQTQLNYTHIENIFNEFEEKALLPNMMSSEGPALATSDINHDGLDDVFVGASIGGTRKVFIQTKNGQFVASNQPALESDKNFEDIDAIFEDINQDSFPDLLVASGGNQYASTSEFLQPRVYLNDGKGNFIKKTDAFPNLFINASSIKALDFTGDGKLDIVIGARTIPAKYGISPNSYFLKGDGTGKFSDATKQYSPDFATIGMVKNLEVIDLDKDHDLDVLVALEWDKICLLENQKGKFIKKELTKENGWWNFMKPFDFDNDGDLDILVGNLGENSRLRASAEEPIRLYINDFDKNGTTDQVLTYYLGNEEVIFANKKEAEKQFPYFKKKFIYAKDFAKAKIVDLLGEENLKTSKILDANYFDNAILVNDGKGNFVLKYLPFNAQFAPYYTAEIIDANHDNLLDVLLMGNFYDCNIQMGRYDADFGTLLINKGNNNFEKAQLNGLVIKGQVRRSKTLNINGKPCIVLAKNNNALEIIRLVK